MIKAGKITEEQFSALDAECKKASEEATRFAAASPEPPLSTLYEDVTV
jgi:TPP-dependent pyruvate/acetoin dehydrogenase alpha subunit